jgi:hypothetical protein
MIIPDINLLVYACDSSSPYHHKARKWWQEVLSGSEPTGLPGVVIFGFVRVSTNPRAFEHPLTAAAATALVRSWLRQPCAQYLESGPAQAEKTLALLEEIGTAGNLVSDAQIAAAAIEHDAILCTADSDFARFTRLRWHNPITGTGSARLPGKTGRRERHEPD